METYIFLSPHLDDVVLSCGGIIQSLLQEGDQVHIWTLFSADPPAGELTPFARSLHERWGINEMSMSVRRMEDIHACRILGAAYRHFDFPDCIYRVFPESGLPVIREEEDLFSPTVLEETQLFHQMRRELSRSLPEKCRLVAPLTLGGHVDHILVRRLATLLRAHFWSYADYPYAEAARQPENMQTETYDFGEAESNIWLDAVAAYESQISTFWDGIPEMRKKISAYRQSGGGTRLWYT